MKKEDKLHKELKDFEKSVEKLSQIYEKLVKQGIIKKPEIPTKTDISLTEDRAKALVNRILRFPFDIPKEKREMITSALVEVFKAADDDILEVKDRIESIIVFDGFTGICRPIFWPDPGQTQTRIQLILPLTLGMSKERVKYFAAHELAHAVLHHFEIQGPPWDKVGYSCEITADRLAKIWGFVLPSSPEQEKKGKGKKKSKKKGG